MRVGDRWIVFRVFGFIFLCTGECQGQRSGYGGAIGLEDELCTAGQALAQTIFCAFGLYGEGGRGIRGGDGSLSRCDGKGALDTGDRYRDGTGIFADSMGKLLKTIPFLAGEFESVRVKAELGVAQIHFAQIGIAQ